MLNQEKVQWMVTCNMNEKGLECLTRALDWARSQVSRLDLMELVNRRRLIFTIAIESQRF